MRPCLQAVTHPLHTTEREDGRIQVTVTAPVTGWYPKAACQAPVKHSVLHWRWASAKRMLMSTHPGLAGQSQDVGTCLASLSSPAFSFSLPPSTGFLPAQGYGMQGEAEANQQSLSFVPFPWHTEGRKAAALLIGINTVTSHLLLPDEETGKQQIYPCSWRS